MAASLSRFRPCLSVALVLAAYWATAQPAVAQSATAETAIPYAPVKRSRGTTVPRERLTSVSPTQYPRRGIVLIFSNGLSRGATWISVDVDARRIERAHTTMQALPDGETETILDSKEGGTLSLVEVNAVVRLANEIWNPPPRPPDLRPPVTDAMCNIVLLDGDAVVSTIASGYDSDPLVKVILDLKTGASTVP